MLQKESNQKSKSFFHKTLGNLKTLFFEGYQKLPNSLPFKHFSCGSKSQRNFQKDPYFSEEWKSDLDEEAKETIISSKEVMKGEDPNGEKFIKFAMQNPVKSKEEKVVNKEDKYTKKYNEQKTEEAVTQKNKGEFALAERMKDLEMIDIGNMEHVLDVEEAIHYYSRLKSPVYLDIVDNFFVDMYTEFSVPHDSRSVNNSKRRFGPMRL